MLAIWIQVIWFSYCAVVKRSLRPRRKKSQWVQKKFFTFKVYKIFSSHKTFFWTCGEVYFEKIKDSRRFLIILWLTFFCKNERKTEKITFPILINLQFFKRSGLLILSKLNLGHTQWAASLVIYPKMAKNINNAFWHLLQFVLVPKWAQHVTHETFAVINFISPKIPN